MQRKKCFATLGVLRSKVLGYGCWGVALTIVIATLTLVRGAVGSQLGAEPDRAGAYNVLHLFTWAKNPIGNLILDAGGNLYGTTSYGGSANCPGGCGAVWKLARNAKGAWTVSILHAFTGPYDVEAPVDGANPSAGLTLDAAGNLYGTTSGGGTEDSGVVFKLAPNPDGTWTESLLHSFTVWDGFCPLAGVIFDTAGNLYGTTTSGGTSDNCVGIGCGVVFKLAPNPDGTWTESVLYSFTGGADGGYPAAGLTLDPAGNLYGTTEYYASGACSPPGAYTGCGVVFKLAPNRDGTWAESVLHSFTFGADGAEPSDGLIFDAGGNLSGTTLFGGSGSCDFYLPGCGVVFNLAPNLDGTWRENVLHSFTGGADGGYPAAGLILDAAGNLYGTTEGGGAYGYGVVFKLSPRSSGWSETVLHTFLGFGAGPTAPVIFDRAGNLYGTTSGATLTTASSLRSRGKGSRRNTVDGKQVG